MGQIRCSWLLRTACSCWRQSCRGGDADPPARPSQPLSGQQAANAAASGARGAEPGPGSGAAGGEGDQAGSVSGRGVTAWPRQRWLGLAVPQALDLSAGTNVPFWEDELSRAVSVGAASPICHPRAVRGGWGAQRWMPRAGPCGTRLDLLSSPFAVPHQGLLASPRSARALAALCCSSFSPQSVAKAVWGGTLSLLHQPRTRNLIKNIIKLL